MARAKALGAKAVIVKKKTEERALLPLFLPDNYDDLADTCGGKTVLLDFSNARILVCE